MYTLKALSHRLHSVRLMAQKRKQWTQDEPEQGDDEDKGTSEEAEPDWRLNSDLAMQNMNYTFMGV